MNMKKLALIIPALLLLAGCAVTPDVSIPDTSPTAVESPTNTTPAETPEASNEPAAQGSAADLLNALTVAEESNQGSYERDLFNHWTSNNSTGCDTRFAVLVEESLVPATTSGCKVTGGQWLSEYDGVKVTVPGDLDIDHMVPLNEAWRSGAYAWDSNTREAFANDLDYADSLIAVTAGSNRSKSDQDPSDWMPDTDGCTYVTKWVNVKHRWNLTVDADEKDAILRVLSFCDDTGSTPAPEAPVTDAPDSPVVEEAPATPEAPAATDSATDPQFPSCAKATAAGYGPYTKGQNPEYDWYRDGDGDGTVCE